MIKFENGKATFTVTVHEDEAVRIDKQAKREGITFERCANALMSEALLGVQVGATTWEEIRELEARSAAPLITSF